MKTKIAIKILLINLLCFSFASVNCQTHKHRKTHRQAPHYRYAKLPHWGHSYKMVPKKALKITHSGINYHYHSGIYYKVVGKNFVIVKPPIGIRVHTLPKDRLRFTLNGKKYFYYYGTYYVKENNNSEYITVVPPIGAKVDALPEGYKKVKIQGTLYYEFEGTYYKEKILENNEIEYEVVDKP